MNHASRFHKYWLLPLTVILMVGVLRMQCSCDVSESHSVTSPNTPIGPASGDTGESLEFATGGSTCNQGHDVEYRFDWDDGNMSDWGAEIRTHGFENAGTYSVRAQARCATKTSIESGWSGGKSVAIEESTTGTMTGNDGKTYQTVKIGSQWWMAENLKETQYRNGDAIPNVTDGSTWVGLSTGARCAYNNNESTADTYGYLYNWYAVDDSRNIAPSGWHVPTDANWTALKDYLVANGYNWDGSTSGNKIGKSLATTSGWQSYGTEGTVGNNQSTNNASGFSALPAGYRDSSDGSFRYLEYYTSFWSATEGDPNLSWGRYLYYHSSTMGHGYNDKQHGFSVRLVRD